VHELKIVGASVIDGTGAPPRECEIAVSGGRINALAPSLGPAHRVTDAGGLFVAPGFIDAHTHASGEGIGAILNAPTAPSATSQGVTTIVSGMCGYSPLEIGAHLDAVAEKGTALNYALVIGHNSIRSHVMGQRADRPKSVELDQMRALISTGMQQGAFGMSTGLWYVPGAYAETDEVVKLAKVVAEYGGIYASHVRSETAETGPAALLEAMEVGRQAGVPVQIAHLKAAEQPAWGQGPDRLALLERGRAEGVDVHADAYPYDASATNLNVLLPADAFEGAGLGSNISDPTCLEECRRYARNRLERIGGPDGVLITVADEPDVVGKRLGEAAEQLSTAPEDLVIRLVLAGYTSAIYSSMDQGDVDAIVTHPLVMIGSDSSVRAPGEGMCHPRTWGTFPKVLARYVRDLGALEWGEAIAKMTSRPAAKFGLQDRGVLREGAWADLVIFDPERVADTATYDDPHGPPVGIRQVLVNGVSVVTDGQPTGDLPGHVLRHSQVA
jgi:N-acyl-D-amino-acid deacylase